MSWRDEYLAIIRRATDDLTTDLPLAERIKAVDAARPDNVSRTSHGRRSWQAARREYLVPFGYVPRGKKIIESPMERMMRRAKQGE